MRWVSYPTIIVEHHLRSHQLLGDWRIAENLLGVRCVCGHEVSVLQEDKDKYLCTLVFFDDESTSDACGERICECPSCGEQLGLHRLMARI